MSDSHESSRRRLHDLRELGAAVEAVVAPTRDPNRLVGLVDHEAAVGLLVEHDRLALRRGRDDHAAAASVPARDLENPAQALDLGAASSLNTHPATPFSRRT